ncbi:alpha-ketoglutarate-dependent dioxygenase AlkB [Mucilaginibacter sp. SMC90]|uniref:alpha-ketoglutarate-dependent dioxygenase AlkB family protein n=1 Tax=Mucilaginibacter sp. SMC90 TaxID=2929803 RepID=UPI001FB3787C|nr:alpha-ketoglutarate-dependent dioxygenase AlkB [Mucilaginibacter sp. SMC90]UOE48100.1 alpha-ketoglutarate-dependent dioxygenase AlkB [Mucilaginibacter sp. SMC90]
MDLFNSDQLNLFGGSKNLLPFDGEVLLYPHFFKEDVFEQLVNETLWKQDKMKIYGKEVNFPRLTAWYGESDKVYVYSGVVNVPVKFSPLLGVIKQAAEQQSGHRFNTALLNYYRDGNDSMGWHSDDESELGGNPVIASVSFGASRVFQFKHKRQKDAKVSVELHNGDLLIMQGKTQHHWLHQVPKTAKRPGPRINITFRWIG